MPVTRYGIYHDLAESTYSMLVDGIEYFFSSKFYMRKFSDRLSDNRIRYISKINKHLSLNNPIYVADLALYVAIEKRGFRVVHKGRELTWQEANALALNLGTLPRQKI